MMSDARLVRTLRCGVFDAQIVEYAPGFSLPEHSHGWSCFQVVLRGQFGERGTGATEPLRAGSLLYRPAGTVHENPRLPRRSVSLCVRPARSDWRGALPILGDVGTPQLTEGADVLAIAGRIRDELERPDDLTASVVESACVELLARVIRRSRRAGRTNDAVLLRRAQALVARERGAAWRVDALASELEVSRHQLNRTFVNGMGCSAGAYLRHRRLLEARRLLEETTTPIARVAQLAGFADQSHMTRRFQEVFGCTPGMVRAGGRGSGARDVRALTRSSALDDAIPPSSRRVV